jgi:hypothetical protein
MMWRNITRRPNITRRAEQAAPAQQTPICQQFYLQDLNDSTGQLHSNSKIMHHKKYIKAITMTIAL